MQPHEQIQEAKGYISGPTERTNKVIAFLCVYEVHRCYGGPEEGGWWYDSYDWTGAAFPFEAEQDYEAAVLDREEWEAANVSGSMQIWYDEEHREPMGWRPVGLPRVTDEPTRVRLESARQHLSDIYGDPDGRSRYSVIGGPDIAFVYELQPGARGKEPRPRYC